MVSTAVVAHNASAGVTEMTWEFETAEGHTIRVTLADGAVAVSTRSVSGAVDGELFDLDTFERSVLPAMPCEADSAALEEIREAIAHARQRIEREDDEVP